MAPYGTRHIVPLICLVLCGASFAAGSDPRPNVVVITVDDMNWDSVGVYGSTVANITPNIDDLAREGLRFEYAHVTASVCAPSRSAWMTGRYPHRSGGIGFDNIDDGVPTLVEELRRSGYLTGLLGKIRHTVSSRADAWHYRIDRGFLGNGRSPEHFEEMAERFLAHAAEDGRPFFLQINIHDPHRPFAGSQQEHEYVERQSDRGWGDYPEVEHSYSADEIEVPPVLPDLPDIRTELAQYYSSVRRADKTVGRILGLLDRFELGDDTVVMFLSDHGMPLPYAKSTLYMYGTRTPWIVRWPGNIKQGKTDRQHVISGIDLMPTVLDIAGVDTPAGVDGRSIRPILLGASQSNRDAVFTYYFENIRKYQYPSRAVNDRRYGYIYNAWPDGEKEFILDDAQSGLTMAAMDAAAKNDPLIAERVQRYRYRVAEELYDYKADRGALINLVDDPEFRSVLTAMRNTMVVHMQETHDPLLSQYRQFIEHQSSGNN